MPVIFDLKKEKADWAESVNDALKRDWPEYIVKNGLVGSSFWWERYRAKDIPSARREGVVTFVGARLDDTNEKYETVEIDQDGNLAEYDHVGYWKDNQISVGAIVLVESFEIEIYQNYGPMKFVYVSLVEVIKT